MGADLNSDIFKILVATDNHLGYEEKDPERGSDSFNTFEEILELGITHQVDFILLGGDLFHENKPSRHCVIRCMDLLKKYTLGDKPVMFDFVSDPAENFKNLKNPIVNYMDPNLNVSVPVFSIHGNHDDPAGMGQFCALDMLSSAGLINYFGQITDLRSVLLSPVLLIKGNTKLALYGMSSIRDERLFRLFRETKVKMLRCKENMDDWFNILVLHQNHVKHSPTNYIPESFLEDFLHLVIWGHEHECLINPRMSEKKNFLITQPGSSVVTSLCPGEAVEKHVGLLEINSQKQMRLTPLKLQTVRPFVCEDVCLSEYDLSTVVDDEKLTEVQRFVEDYVEELIEKSKKLLTGHARQPKKPLIRLRVEYSKESQLFNVCRFGFKFMDRVANPHDIVKFVKEKQDSKKKELGIDKDVMEGIFECDVSEARVEDVVHNYFAELENEVHQLQLLSERGLAHAVASFVEKDNRDAFDSLVESQIRRTKEALKGLNLTDENKITEAIYSYKLERKARQNSRALEEQEAAEDLANTVLGDRMGRVPSNADEDVVIVDDDDELQNYTTRSSVKRSRSQSHSSFMRSRGGKATVAKASTSIQSCETMWRGRGRGRRAVARNQTTMESYVRASQSSRSQSQNKGRGVFYGSDSD